MATKHQIMLVKTIHRRLKELLGDNKVTVTVSYISASDILRITFKKVLKGAAFELPICTSLKKYTLHPEILQYIVTDALEKMPKPPKWTMETILHELRRRYSGFTDYCRPMPVRSRNASVFGAGFTSLQDATIAYYSLCGGEFARSYDFSSSDLDLFESSFERDAGLTSGGEYTRWREAGEPKRWTDPVDSFRAMANPDNGVAPVMGVIRHVDGSVAVNPHWTIQGTQHTNTWIDETHDMPQRTLSWEQYLQHLRPTPTYFAGQPVPIPAPLPNTLFGLPVIWADELPPAQGSTNEQT